MSFSNMPVVSVKDTTIFQKQHVVLSDVFFEIAKGEFVYLIGRTGSGKSSLLKTLYADLPLYSGDITVAGFQLYQIPRKTIPFLRRKIGIVFQDFQLLMDRTVTENLLFAMRATGWKDSSKIKQRLSEVLLKVGLGAAGNKMPHQLSGGEQQRVVIARALINEPHILFADEPTGNLDPQVADEIMEIFVQINRSGTAILMATHNYQFLEKYPARVLKCENGKVLDSNIHEFDYRTTWFY
ncbi:cell division ATP-binding protein FtsE [Raineya orbicola]|uniref:Cell division ATP-binding protein FtsE n=1 Tax=Raineya orbicola TaxID=2016530 RepID=A0A2N3I7K4_9BACT|nr:ATP-binding cassette domain-containing protein [Raineya orbicola]PKQ66312.1 putative ATPase involved in cell division [Raineya orbicola]